MPAVSDRVRRARWRCATSSTATPAPALRDYGLALAAAVAIGFLADVGPGHWRDQPLRRDRDQQRCGRRCAPAWCWRWPAWLRHAQAMVTRGFADRGARQPRARGLLLLEPRCIGGPFAMVDPAIWPIWHSHVRELQPLVSVFRVNPLTAAGIAAFPAVGAARDAGARLAAASCAATSASSIAAAVFLTAAAITVLAIRGYSYAIWLGMPLVAAAALRLFAVLPAQQRAGAAGRRPVLTPMVLSAGAITHRARRRPRRHRQLRPAGQPALLRDRELRGRWRGCRPGWSSPTSATGRSCWR